MSDQPSRTIRNRFVTLCQQLLAMATVAAVLTPAARTITMDVRPMPLGGTAPSGSAAGSVGMAAYVRAAQTPSRVPVGPVKPDIASYPLTAPRGSRLAPRAVPARMRRTTVGGSEIDTSSLPVRGFGGVGVTWAPGVHVPSADIRMQARTLEGGKWSGWSSLGLDDGGPDAGTAEARAERPGTEMLFVGHAKRVQLRIDTTTAPPPDLRVTVVGPGTPARTRLERPAIDTALLGGTPGDEQALLRRAPDGPSGAGSSDLALASASYTPRPKIYSRAQWGADESLRDKPSLHYGDVHAGFIHHTVQANDYTRAEVPGLIRADYYYHTQVRGWSDIGYNYLVDRFGRIWEGRYGGVDRDPVGAHTLGYNDDSFAASAIGNYQVKQPSAAMVQAYAALFAWKLSLAGVDAMATHQYVTSRYFDAINGHRDAGQTLCPGKYLYAKIPQIRRMAENLQAGWAGRTLHSNLAGSTGPDVVARRTSDGEGMILPIDVSSTGVPTLGTAIDTGIDLSGAASVMNVGDWDGDGHGDLVVRRTADPQDVYLYRGLGTGRFAAPVLLSSAMKGFRMLTAVGDYTGDGRPDLMAETGTGPMEIFPGRATTLGAPYPAYGHIPVRKQIGVGRWDADGAPDTMVRTTGSQLTVYFGNGPGGIVGHSALPFDASSYDQVVAVSSANGDGHTDLVVRTAATGRLWLVPGTTGKPRPRIALGYAKGYNMFG